MAALPSPHEAASALELQAIPSWAASMKTVGCGVGDSFLVEDYLDAPRANEVLADIDTQITYLSRQDPRMQFKLYGKELALPRDKAVLGELQHDVASGETMEPFYKYAVDTPPVESWRDTVLETLKTELGERCAQQCNHVVVNQYRSGNDHIGLHHDKSKSFVKDSSVMTVSLGASRILRLRKVKGDGVGTVRDVVLKNGSLFVLGPETNRQWKHSIVKRARVDGRRVSLTFRAIEATRVQRKLPSASDPAAVALAALLAQPVL